MQIDVRVDYLTPSGRSRAQPLYWARIRNEFLGKECVVKASDQQTVQHKCAAKLNAWAAQERLAREGQSTHLQMAALPKVLSSGLIDSQRTLWESLAARQSYPPFQFNEPEPEPPRYRSSLESFLSIQLNRRQLTDEEYRLEMERWSGRKAAALEQYNLEKARFEATEAERLESLRDLKRRFESGEVEAICEFLSQVFGRSECSYPFFIEHAVSYDAASWTAIVDVSLPPPNEIGDVVDYKFVKSTRESKPIRRKPKEHEQLYESVLHQVALRTMHEVFQSDYTNYVAAVVVNGWVTSLNRATGNDQTSCVFSVHVDRETFEVINLSRVDPSECFRNLKGLVAGALAQLSPVKPILHLNRDDDRFVESREVLASINAHANLAEIPWQEFEHLVRDLFEKEFGREGAQVKVTQSSRDGGVDAVAFDPDPIRGGKFVIQAKRYLKNVPVSAVRDLYGTMIHEGATKGILVTTSHYGRDARKFASDKPITLINGNELVFMLEQHGHKVRIDIAEAKAKRVEQRLAAAREVVSRESGDSK